MSFVYQQFPISIPWFYKANVQGLAISTNGDTAHVSRTSGGAQNQWTNFTNPTAVSTGWTVEFDIRYITISPITEVKLSLINNLHLRFDDHDSKFKYQRYDSQGQFVTICNSGITLGNTNFTTVSLSLKSDGIEISEGGTVLGKWTIELPSSLPLDFSWQIFNGNSQFSADFKNVTAKAPLPA